MMIRARQAEPSTKPTCGIVSRSLQLSLFLHHFGNKPKTLKVYEDDEGGVTSDESVSCWASSELGLLTCGCHGLRVSMSNGAPAGTFGPTRGSGVASEPLEPAGSGILVDAFEVKDLRANESGTRRARRLWKTGNRRPGKKAPRPRPLVLRASRSSSSASLMDSFRLIESLEISCSTALNSSRIVELSCLISLLIKRLPAVGLLDAMSSPSARVVVKLDASLETAPVSFRLAEWSLLLSICIVPTSALVGSVGKPRISASKHSGAD